MQNGYVPEAISNFESDWSVERPDLNPSGVSLDMRLQCVAHHFSEATSEALAAFDLEWWEYDVLSELRRLGKPYERSVNEINDILPLSSGARTHRLNRLVQRQLVTRRNDDIDRRRVMVRLTDAGFQLVDEAATARFSAAAHAAGRLSHTEKARLNTLLNKLLGKPAGAVALNKR